VQEDAVRLLQLKIAKIVSVQKLKGY